MLFSKIGEVGLFYRPKVFGEVGGGLGKELVHGKNEESGREEKSDGEHAVASNDGSTERGDTNVKNSGSERFFRRNYCLDAV